MKSFRIRTRTARILASIFFSLLGTGAIGWGTLLLQTFWKEASPRSVASKLLQGDTFKPQSLVDQAYRAENVARYSYCNPAALHSVFILRLFIFNASNEPDTRELADSTYPPLYDAVVKSLSCAPTDAFAWLTLFWLNAGKHGIDDRNTGYLRLSYAFGRNEGWISLWRLRLAFLVFERLPTDVASAAVDEFVRLVNNGQQYWLASGIFKDASLIVQGRIVEGLKAATLTSRANFARALRGRDMNIDIPGVENTEVRPW